MVIVTHVVRKLLEESPHVRLPLEAVLTLKIGIDKAQTDRHGTVSASCDLCLGMGTFVRRQNVQDLPDLGVWLGTSLVSCHGDNRPSTHVRIVVAASTQACASRRAIVPGT